MPFERYTDFGLFRTWKRLVFSIAAIVSAGCSSGASAPSPIAIVAPAATTPGAPAGDGTMNVSFYVPVHAPTTSIRLSPQYISRATQSLLAIIDEPGTAQTNLQHRMEVHNLTPDPKTGLVKLTLYAPPGSLTLQMKLYTQPNATGGVLSITDKQNITLDAVTPQTVNVTFNPVVASAALDFLSTSSRVASCTAAPVNETNSTIVLTSGKVTVAAVDAAGDPIVGAGTFIDENDNPVTFSVVPYTGGPFGIFSNFQPVSASGVLTSPESAGVFSEQITVVNPAAGILAWVVSMTSSSPALSGGGSYVLASALCTENEYG